MARSQIVLEFRSQSPQARINLVALARWPNMFMEFPFCSLNLLIKLAESKPTVKPDDGTQSARLGGGLNSETLTSTGATFDSILHLASLESR